MENGKLKRRAAFQQNIDAGQRDSSLSSIFNFQFSIFNSKSLWLFAAVAALIAGGCSSPPPPPRPQPAPLTSNPRFYEHAEIMKKEMAELRTVGAFISTRMYENYRYSPDELIGHLRQTGITQIYLLSEGYGVNDFGEELPGFLAAMRKAGIPAWIVVTDRIFYERDQKSFVSLTTSEINYDKQLNQRIQGFYDMDGVFGIVLALTPNINSHQRHRNLYAWGENTYGIGGSNDMLMKQSYAMASDIRRKFRGKPLALIIPGLFHAKAAAGELSVGRIRDFLPLADQLIVTAFAAVPEGQLKVLQPQFEEAASMGKQLVVCLLTDDHFSSLHLDSLSRGTFNEFMEKMSSALAIVRNETGFGGVAFMNFRGVEILLEKTE